MTIEFITSGRFIIHKSNNKSVHVRLQNTRPYWTDEILEFSFSNSKGLDNKSDLHRQFEIEKEILISKNSKSQTLHWLEVGKNKPYETSNGEKLTAVDYGTFQILHSDDNLRTIEFNGVRDVFKGLFDIRVDKSDSKAFMIKRNDTINDSCSSTIDIIKASKEEQIVFGEVLIPEEIDAQGDIYDEKVIRDTAWDFMDRYRRLGYMHQSLVNLNDFAILESYIAPVDMELETNVPGQKRFIKKGTWLLLVRIKSKVLWYKIKSGEITGFSIGGIAKIEDLKKLRPIS